MTNFTGVPRHRGFLTMAELVAREELAAKRRQWEDRLDQQLKAFGLPIPEREARFHPDRRWRFDFYWRSWKLAVEVEGLTFEGGRHQRPAGYTQDLDKYNAAAALGIQVLRFTPMHVRSGRAIRDIEAAFERLKK